MNVIQGRGVFIIKRVKEKPFKGHKWYLFPYMGLMT